LPPSHPPLRAHSGSRSGACFLSKGPSLRKPKEFQNDPQCLSCRSRNPQHPHGDDRSGKQPCIIVDDNGLTDEIPCFTEVADYASPLAGNLLIVGTDQFGETVSPKRPIEDFAAILTIRFPVLSPTFEAISGPHVFGSRVSGFTATLKAANPAVIATA
jgi:hypothetical protein